MTVGYEAVPQAAALMYCNPACNLRHGWAVKFSSR